MPQRQHALTVQERKEIAFKMFARGGSNSDVRDTLEVSRDTVARYRAEYEDQLQEEAENNPDLMHRVLDNTIRALAELEEVRAEAWLMYETTNHPTVKQGYLKTVLTAQKQRAELFGLFGVKAEYMAYVNQVKTVQDKLLTFMREELCDDDRRKLEEYIAVALAPHMGQELPAIDVSA